MRTDGDYISRETAIDVIFGQFCASSDETEAALNSALEDIKSLPATAVRPVVRGKWRQIGPKEAVCSVCNNVTLTNGIDRTGHANIHKALYHFCPNCGADMRGKQDV